MAKRRILYLLCLSASTIYYIFDTRYFSWMLLLIVLLLPLISIITTFLYSLKCTIKIGGNTNDILMGEELPLYINLIDPQPVTSVYAEVTVENFFYNTKSKHKFYIPAGQNEQFYLPFNTEKCGHTRYSITRACMTDFLNMITIPILASGETEVYILPEKIDYNQEEFEKSQNAAGIFDPFSQTASQGDWDQYDIRQYQPGDPIKDIHWKLSARYQELVIREYDYQPEVMLYVAFLVCGTCDEVVQGASLFLAFTKYLKEQSIAYGVLWVESYKDNKNLQINELLTPDEDEIFMLLCDGLSKPPFMEKATALQYLKMSSYAAHKSIILITGNHMTLLSLLNSEEDNL